jgi:CheY-like chemotaxis protein
MGGWEFLDHFNSSNYSEFNTTKVIILSSTIDPQDIEKAKTYPIVMDFLSKPITPSMIEYLKSQLL